MNKYGLTVSLLGLGTGIYAGTILMHAPFYIKLIGAEAGSFFFMYGLLLFLRGIRDASA
ncbi:hypothetical protein SAMN02799624_04222 [Paenibacillus sp. UNC496MF]|uniref:hypothetical protein n=1 Tax=Paenibacillus sp. UNC496MF TaxID=1502753 RepID=UPI0008EDB29D|nr:hypothetical protein [Paenibacillus sp. UNC496MF]SFJ35422.1 hypothetical protein SAMN02799624_04222 [Paenibacillus sp. UNC496MF]